MSDDKEHGASSVGFVLSSHVLITVRFAAFPEFDSARALCAARETQTSEDAFLHVLEMIVDRAADDPADPAQQRGAVPLECGLRAANPRRAPAGEDDSRGIRHGPRC